MHCPYCRHTDTRVLDSRVADEGGSIRRRRTCSDCDRRFTTVEKMQLTVLKRSGATEPFEREKAIAGVRKACKGRPVSDAQLACLGQEPSPAIGPLVRDVVPLAPAALASVRTPRSAPWGELAVVDGDTVALVAMQLRPGGTDPTHQWRRLVPLLRQATDSSSEGAP